VRGAGAVLILWGAAALFLQRRREELLPLRLGRALLEDLAVLACQVRVCRTPLPRVLSEHLAEGLGAVWLWRPLLERLGGEEGLPRCWRAAVRALPSPLDRLLAPLGPLLPEGGETLEAAIEETREELTGFVRAEAARQAGQGRITAALCLSGACLLILVLL
jgi:hypothetical protein